MKLKLNQKYSASEYDASCGIGCSFEFVVYRVKSGKFRIRTFSADFGPRWATVKDDNGKVLEFDSMNAVMLYCDGFTIS